MKIVHIITNLEEGGAENSLYKICKNDRINQHIVISIIGLGKYSSLLKKINIKVYCLHIKFYSFIKFLQMIKLLHDLKPDIVQTWLVYGDFIGGIAAKIAGIKNIIWNIRYSSLDTGMVKLRTILFIKILASLSFFIPKLILVNSKSGKKNCQLIGYCKKKLYFIPNGFETSILKPNKNLKLNFRKRINILDDVPLIGNLARYDSIKDHKNLLNALALINLKNIKFHCVLVGSNINKKNKSLLKELKKLRLNNHVKLLGGNQEIQKIMNGLDIFVQSSKSEGFPNVLAEAMACGTPCIATNVGDSAFIVGDTGWLVPPSNSKKLAKVISSALSQIKTIKWQKRCAQANLRIYKNFEISKMVKSYNRVWNKVFYNN